MQITGKHIVLIGASGGIGAAVAQALDAAGALLLLVARDAAQLKRLRNNLRGHQHQIAAVDITTAAGREELLDTARAFSADVLINNAGSGQLALLDDIDDADIERLIAVNLTAPMLLCRAFVPLLRERREAVIVNVGSILGSIGFAGSTAYCASKFGLRGFSEALRRELADTSIRTIYFAPRATDTALNSSAAQAMNKALGNAVDSPDHVAAQLLKALAKPTRAHHFLGWPEALFVRLNSLLPALVDRAVRKQLTTIRHHAQR
jgi:short-subunit dehydrogenase